MVIIDDVIQIDVNSGFLILEIFNVFDFFEIESILVFCDVSVVIYGFCVL